jgi:large subunit ribosomal protein L18
MRKRTEQQPRARRHLRLRQKVKGTAQRPRLCINRTLKHIHAQLIDDVSGLTVASASTVQKDVAGALNGGGTGNREAAKTVGRVIAERAQAAGIEAAVFDRNGLKYHGAVKELADAAREGGLKF